MLSLPPELRIEALTHEASALIVTLSTTMDRAPCTLCQTYAWRVHSRYVRTLADLPCSGQTVILRWQVRKWFCPNPTCARKINTLAIPYLHGSLGPYDAAAGGGAPGDRWDVWRRCWESSGQAPRDAQQPDDAATPIPGAPTA